jgi:hypothetical protein
MKDRIDEYKDSSAWFSTLDSNTQVRIMEFLISAENKEKLENDSQLKSFIGSNVGAVLTIYDMLIVLEKRKIESLLEECKLKDPAKSILIASKVAIHNKEVDLGEYEKTFNEATIEEIKIVTKTYLDVNVYRKFGTYSSAAQSLGFDEDRLRKLFDYIKDRFIVPVFYNDIAFQKIIESYPKKIDRDRIMAVQETINENIQLFLLNDLKERTALLERSIKSLAEQLKNLTELLKESSEPLSQEIRLDK